MSIGSRLRAARIKADLTQKQVAGRLGWDTASNSRLSQYENDRREPTLGDIAKLAKEYGADPAQIAFGEGELSPQEASIIQAYRNASDEGRGFILSACEASRPMSKGRKRKGDE